MKRGVRCNSTYLENRNYGIKGEWRDSKSLNWSISGYAVSQKSEMLSYDKV